MKRIICRKCFRTRSSGIITSFWPETNRRDYSIGFGCWNERVWLSSSICNIENLNWIKIIIDNALLKTLLNFLQFKLNQPKVLPDVTMKNERSHAWNNMKLFLSSLKLPYQSMTVMRGDCKNTMLLFSYWVNYIV